MPLDKKKLAFGNETQVAVSLARSTGTAGSPGAFTQICLMGNFSLPWSWTEGGDDDGTADAWCTSDTDIYTTFIPDKKQLETSLPMPYMPGDAFQLSLETDAKAGEQIYLRAVYTDTQTTPATKTHEFKGWLLDWPLDTPKGQATTLTPRFRASAEKPGGGWPTS